MDDTSQAGSTGHDPSLAERINAGLRYAMVAVFATGHPLPASDVERRALAIDAEEAVLDGHPADPAGTEPGLVVRGWYDVAGLRADADLMVWWHGDSVESVQAAYHRLRASALGVYLEPVWSMVAMHRPAEFNRAHVPAFLAGEPPREYLCVYPFVRSYDWYVLPEAERSRMLREHGMAARGYADVRANTLSAFALGDYEWLLAFEANELHRIVDLMRDLRATEARRHVRVEVPFFTGPRVPLGEWANRQPLEP